PKSQPSPLLITPAVSSLSLALTRWRRANEISRVVRAAAPFVASHLRIRAKRPRPGSRALGINALAFRGDDLIRSDALFHPALERNCHVVLRVGRNAGNQ